LELEPFSTFPQFNPLRRTSMQRQPNPPRISSVRKGAGPFRFYHSDPVGPDPAINILADTVSFGLGLFMEWWDLVAISMEPDPATGDTPPLRSEVLATITEMVAGIGRWGHTWGSTWNPPLWQNWP
jgi:hypothetical protein